MISSTENCIVLHNFTTTFKKKLYIELKAIITLLAEDSQICPLTSFGKYATECKMAYTKNEGINLDQVVFLKSTWSATTGS